MTRDEALSEAVIGERVRAVDMPEGVYIDYHFNGWRINFPGGSSSGYGFKDHDLTVDWEVYVPPAPKGWDMTLVKAPEPTPAPKRRGRRAWVPPAEINDIDDAKPCAHETRSLCYTADGAEVETCLDCGTQLKIGPVPWAETPEPKPSNPWAEAGLTSEEKPATGWPIFNKGTGND